MANLQHKRMTPPATPKGAPRAKHAVFSVKRLRKIIRDLRLRRPDASIGDLDNMARSLL